MLGSLINSIEAIVSLLVLLFLFLGIFALLGTQVFGGKFRERKVSGRGFSKPRANFDTFSESFYAVFQVTFTDINSSNSNSGVLLSTLTITLHARSQLILVA